MESVIPRISAFPTELPTKTPHSSMKKQLPSSFTDSTHHETKHNSSSSFSISQQQHLSTTLTEFFKMCDTVLSKYRSLLQPNGIEIRRVSSSTGSSSEPSGSSVLQKTTSTRSSLPSASMSSGGFVASPYASNVGGRYSQTQGMQHAAVFAPVMAMDAISRLGSGDPDDASFLQLLQSVMLGGSLSTATTGGTGGSLSGANSISVGGGPQRIVTASRTSYANKSPMKPPSGYLGTFPVSSTLSNPSPRSQLTVQTTAPAGGSFVDAEGHASEPFDTFPVELTPSEEDVAAAPPPANKTLSVNDRRGLVLFSPSAVDDPPPHTSSFKEKRQPSQHLSAQQQQPPQDESSAIKGRSAQNSLWSEGALFGGNSPQQLSAVLPSILASMGLTNWENLEVGRFSASESNGPLLDQKDQAGAFNMQLVSGLLSKNLLKDLLIIFEYIETLKGVWSSLTSKASGGTDSVLGSNSGSGKKDFPELPSDVGQHAKSPGLSNQHNVNARTEETVLPPPFLHRAEGDAFDEDKSLHIPRHDRRGSHTKGLDKDDPAAVSGTSSGETTPRGSAAAKRRISSNHSGGSEIVEGDELNDVHVNTEQHDNTHHSPTTLNNNHNVNTSLHSSMHSAASSLHSVEGPGGLFSQLTSPVLQPQSYYHTGASPPAIHIHEGSSRGHPVPRPANSNVAPGAAQSVSASNLVPIGARHSSYVHSTSPMLINILPTSSQRKHVLEGGVTGGERSFSPNHVGIAKFQPHQHETHPVALMEAHQLPTELGSFRTGASAIGAHHPFTVRAQRFGTDEEESPNEEKIVVAKKAPKAVSRPALASFSAAKGTETPETAAVGASTSTLCPGAVPPHPDDSSTQTPSTDDEASPPLKTEHPVEHRHGAVPHEEQCIVPHPPLTTAVVTSLPDVGGRRPQQPQNVGKAATAYDVSHLKSATKNPPTASTHRSGSQAMSSNGMMSVMNPVGVASSLLVSVDWESRSDVSRYSMQSGEALGQFSPADQPPHPTAVVPRQSNHRPLTPRMKLLDDVIHRYSSAKATFQLAPVLNEKYLLLCGIGHFLGARGGGGGSDAVATKGPQPVALLEPNMSEEVMVVLHLEVHRHMVLKIFSGAHSILLGGHRHSAPGAIGCGTSETSASVVAARKIKNAQRAAALQDLERLRLLRHPHLVTLFDVFDDEEAERLYLVMEYAEHGSIGTVLDDGTCTTKLSIEALIRVAHAVAGVLAYLHKEGVAHRNLCPENILVDRENSVLVGGAGLPEDCSRHSFLTTAFSPIQQESSALPFPSLSAPNESTSSITTTPLFEADILALGRTLILLWDDDNARQELMKPGRNTMTSLFLYPHPPQGVSLTVEKSSMNGGSSSSRVLARKSFSYTLPPQDRPPVSVDVSPLAALDYSPPAVATNLTISQHVPSSSCRVDSSEAPLGTEPALAPTLSNSAFGSGRDSSSTPSERSDETSPPTGKTFLNEGMRRLIESCLQVNGTLRPTAQKVHGVLEEYMHLL